MAAPDHPHATGRKPRRQTPLALLGSLSSEATYLLASIVLVWLAFQLIYWRSSPLTTARTVLALFFGFIIPGSMILLAWRRELPRIERLVISVPLGMGVVGSLSYFLGLAGVHGSMHGAIIPPFVILAGFFWTWYRDGTSISDEGNAKDKTVP